MSSLNFPVSTIPKINIPKTNGINFSKRKKDMEFHLRRPGHGTKRQGIPGPWGTPLFLVTLFGFRVIHRMSEHQAFGDLPRTPPHVHNGLSSYIVHGWSKVNSAYYLDTTSPDDGTPVIPTPSVFFLPNS